MSCNSTKCATCDGSCGDKPVARPSSPPMVSLPLSLYNHLVNLKDEVEKLRKQTEDPATDYDVRTVWCEACVGMAKERDELKARLEFLYQEFGKAEADTLTRDALELKLRITEQERDDARAEVERLRGVIQEWSYPRLYVQPGVERETLLAQLQENLVNKVRPSIEAAEERGARWALERHGNPFATKTLTQYAEEICKDARGKT